MQMSEKSPVSGNKSLRASASGRRGKTYRMGCAVAALCAGTWGTSAFAANECGAVAGGTVTCAPSAGNYPAGITYVSPGDITVNAPAGVTVATTAPATNGISITGAGASTLAGAATVTTTGDGSNGVVVSGGTGATSVNVGNVTTSGALSGGIIATGGLNQNVTVNAGNVTTNGTAASAFFFLPSSAAVSATATGTGAVTVNTGALSTAADGAAALTATGGGDVNVTTGAITTLGASNGVSATSTTGNVNVNVTGATAIAGNQVSGVYASALNGAANVQVQNVTMAGTFANNGVVATAGAGGANITANNVAVGGTFGTGLQATSTGGNATIAANAITATGTANTAAYASSDVGNASITTTGNVIANGRGSFGLIAMSGTGNASITATNVSTVAYNPADTLTNGNAVLAQGANATVVVSGTAATSGTAQYNGLPYSGTAVTANATNGTASVTVQNAQASGAAANAIAANATGGTAHVIVNGIASTSGANADAVTAVSTTGAADVADVGTISATGMNSRGIYANGVTSATVSGISAGTVTTTGDLSPAIYATSATGPVGVAIKSVSTTGMASDGIDATSATGTVGINAGSIATTGATSNGVVAMGNGAVTVTTGTVNTAGANSSGIIATSVAGPVTVNAGTTTVTGLGGNAINATGSGAVNVISGAASANNAAAIIATSLTTDANVNLTGGAVKSTTSDGVDITGATVATLTTAAGSSISGGVNGVTIVAPLGTTVNNAGTLSGTGYALAATGGPAVVNNTGTINGAVSLLGAGNVVNNSGTFNATGTSLFGGTGTFNNAGLLAIAATGQLPSVVTFGGLGTFNNSGLIEMRNGVAGDVLTLSGNYVGSGKAALGIDLAPGVAVDRLNIGGTATGSTNVLIALAPGSTPVFNPGTTIVQAGAASSATAFAVSPTTQNYGLVRYGVVYNPATFTYALIATPSDSAYNLLSYQTAERNLWYKSADAVSAQLQSKRDTLWNMGGTAPSGRFWVTMAGSVDNVHGNRNFGVAGQTNTTDTGYQQDYFGGQLGLDVSGGVSSRGGYSLGVTGGYINSNLNLGSRADSTRFNAVNGGVYASVTQGNIFATALGKYDYYWINPSSINTGFDFRTHGHSYGARGELGIRVGGNAFFLEPVAQLSYIRVALNPFAFQGTSVDFNTRNGFQGKLGGRIGGNTGIANGKVAFYAGGNYVHDFQGTSEVTFANTGGAYTVYGLKARDYGEGVAGVNISSNNRMSGFFEANYKHTFGSGDNGQMVETGFGGRAGLRLAF